MAGTGSLSLDDRLKIIETDIKDHKGNFEEHEDLDQKRHEEMQTAMNEVKIVMSNLTLKIAFIGGIAMLAGNWIIKKYG